MSAYLLLNKPKGVITSTRSPGRRTVLDFIPFVGGAKNAAEIVRGRDFIADRRGVTTR